MRNTKSFSRREWLSVMTYVGAGALAHNMPARSIETPASGLLSPRMLEYVGMQDGELIIDSVFSTLDKFMVHTPDLKTSAQDCPEFAIAVCDAGLEFHSHFISSRALTQQILELADWDRVKGTEQIYRTGSSWSAHQVVARAKQLASRIMKHYGVSRERREAAAAHGHVIALAVAFERAGVVDRETSPFFHAAFRFPDWRGDWNITNEVLVSGVSVNAKRFARYLIGHGAHEQSENCFMSVPYTRVLEALNLKSPG